MNDNIHFLPSAEPVDLDVAVERVAQIPEPFRRVALLAVNTIIEDAYRVAAEFDMSGDDMRLLALFAAGAAGLDVAHAASADVDTAVEFYKRVFESGAARADNDEELTEETRALIAGLIAD